MSDLRPSDVLAVLCSDIHLSHKAPVARSAEPDWYAAQARVLNQVRSLCEGFDAPCVIAGDIFDHWKAPPELINFAMGNLPRQVFAVPGQHDLPLHNYEDMQKSAYGVLVSAGRIKTIPPRVPRLLEGMTLHGFPWGYPVKNIDRKRDPDVVSVAVIHSYIWTKGKSYPDAPKTSSATHWSRQLRGYDTAVFGDNHKGFWFMGETGEWDPWVINCGTLMRRKADEITYKPQVALLLTSGAFRVIELDTSEDKFIDLDQALSLVEKTLDMSDFIAELSTLGAKGLDFLEAIQRFVKDNKVDDRVRKIILESIKEPER